MLKIRMTELNPKPKHGRPKGWRETWELHINDEPVGYVINDPMFVEDSERPDWKKREKINSFLLVIGGLEPTRHRSRTDAVKYIQDRIDSLRPDLIDPNLDKELTCT